MIVIALQKVFEGRNNHKKNNKIHLLAMKSSKQKVIVTMGPNQYKPHITQIMDTIRQKDKKTNYFIVFFTFSYNSGGISSNL